MIKLNSAAGVSALMLASCALAANVAQADPVVFSQTGLIHGQQIFSKGFDVPVAGTVTVTLTAIPWLDTLQDLNCFLSTPQGVLGATFNGATETMQIGPGLTYLNWSGDANGTYQVGAYSLQVQFQPTAPVPVPPALPLLLTGLGVVGLAGRRRRLST